ncbi:MAG: molecular chaperone Hsp33 [Alphaproteobacteria bacterium]|nr:MAG: molecular chaperone Hsp33 [Alphaproteobacteria bacterium]
MVVAAEGSRDDRVRPFSLERVPVRGRIVRLGPMLDEILALHGYPEAIAGQLARLSALAALLGSMLKTKGRVTVQARGQADAPLSFMVADYRAPDGPGEAAGLRAYAAFDEAAAARLDEDADLVAWCGSRGDLAFTLESGPKAERWQGIVPLVDGDLARAAEHYFEQSEQIPTRLTLAAGRRGTALAGWRAGGLLIQHMPTGGNEEREADTDGWPRVQMLFETLRADELLDPVLDDDALLWRLFHEEGVRVFAPVPLAHRCSCSRDKVCAVVAELSSDEREHLIGEDGAISVRCQFCGRAYHLDPSDFATVEQGG